MDRIRQLKLAMTRLKKRNFSSRIRLSITPGRMDVIRVRKRETNRLRIDDRRKNGLCYRCTRPSVLVRYEFEGLLIMQYKSKACPYHWESKKIKEEMMNVLSPTANIPVVSLDTLSTKPDESNPSKQC